MFFIEFFLGGFFCGIKLFPDKSNSSIGDSEEKDSMSLLITELDAPIYMIMYNAKCDLKVRFSFSCLHLFQYQSLQPRQLINLECSTWLRVSKP